MAIIFSKIKKEYFYLPQTSKFATSISLLVSAVRWCEVRWQVKEWIKGSKKQICVSSIVNYFLRPRLMSPSHTMDLPLTLLSGSNIKKKCCKNSFNQICHILILYNINIWGSELNVTYVFWVINLVIKCVSWILKYNISSISYRRNKCVFVFSFDDALGGFVRVLFLVCWFGSKEDK